MTVRSHHKVTNMRWLYPAVWARYRMVTRVLAKTTKVKTILIERKISKEYSVVFLVEGEKFRLRICLRGLHLCCRFCCEHERDNASVRSISQQPIPNIAGLVPSVFFCPQPWFLRRSKHIYPGETRAFLCG